MVCNPRRYKTSLVGQSAGLSVPRSPVRFRQKLQKSKTQIFIVLRAKLPDRFLRINKSNSNQSWQRSCSAVTRACQACAGICAFFALCVACTEQVSWTLVHLQVCAVHTVQFFLTPVYISGITTSAGCACALVYAQFVHYRSGTSLGGICRALLWREMLTDFACITSQEKKDVAGSSICSTIIDIKKNTCFASIFTFSCNFNISNPYGFDMNLQSRVLNYFNQEY